MRISFISKFTRLHKAMTAANDTSLCFTMLVLFLEFHPGRPGWNFPYEQTTKFAPVAEPARLPGSYEEALKQTSRTLNLVSFYTPYKFFSWPHEIDPYPKYSWRILQKAQKSSLCLTHCIIFLTAEIVWANQKARFICLVARGANSYPGDLSRHAFFAMCTMWKRPYLTFKVSCSL